ncbi:PD40 domain-containing protein [Longimicrobium terrae]|uniref:Tol biopolymer transport system component n=1 Tax=Longimicrobium terrae TaxID=1639882 RepID=A0A841H7E5_9BACT|nr:PD40 domain-containing protein [Longimicrobium terrae]MBB4639685.1 Tol biopolymer transport system component [Longimicrobium terrae]MBB6074081.1 Tol biopolymer transport system component [Longimicrobium terrae]NNC28695.1 peptidase S9 [Longimicrobium terrae]
MSAVSRLRVLCAVAALCAGATALGPAPAEAQYFGRNKVQYQTFDFRILRTTHFDVYYYPEEEVAARDAARMAERWYGRLSQVLEYEFEQRQPLILYASHPHFQQTTSLGGDIGEGTGGVTEAFKQRIILPMANAYAETDHVVGHELVHAFQYDISGLGRAQGGIEQAAQRFNVPAWFTEGMAEYLSIGPVDPHTAMWLRDAALTGRIPTLEQLTFDPSFFPYRWGQAFWAYVGGRWGDAAVGQILKQVGQGVPYPEAFSRIVNVPLEEISEDWANSIRRTYLPLLNERREAREQGQPTITQREQGGRLNVAPVVSPDGRRIAFLSELNFLDVQLYVADAQTGEVLHRLVRGTSFDPHYGSLRYINSAGSWSPDSRRFAFSALVGGRDVISIIDAQRGSRLREYDIDGVSEITNPTWSPDGSTIVVSGLRGGVSDLYAVDVNTGRSRQLTNDKYADMQPMFSPDGRTLAFVTDRDETNLETLSFASYRIGLMDFPSGAVRTIDPGGEGKAINPQWTQDGTGLFFIGDVTGISNIYRVQLATGAVTQVTDLFTGVSGITDLSPAISSAQRDNRLIFAAYERDGFNIYSITDPTELAGTTPRPVQVAAAGRPGVPLPALLPPVPRPEDPPFNRVLLAVNEYQTGLPSVEEQATWTVVPYRPRLSLDYLGQPVVGASVGGGPYNRGGLYGGISGIFSDQLGQHTVYGTIQAQGQLDEIGFSTLYLNQTHRWNWGVSAQRIPYIYGGLPYEAIDEEAQEYLQQLVTLRFFDTSLNALAQYPFSQVQRLEFSAGVRRFATDTIIRELVYPIIDGQVVGLSDIRDRHESGVAYNMGQASVALAYDNALQGYTSPFAGQRYRFEVSPTVGSLQFTNATADYRRYIFARPFTLAVRALHVGRYGRDEARLQPYFLGWPMLLRGYDPNGLYNSCRSSIDDNNVRNADCQLYDDELRGSRVGVANVELRLPMFRQIIVGNSIGLPPVEAFGFFDAGSAWGNVLLQQGGVLETRPTFRRGVDLDNDRRGIVTSGGAGARVNLFGYAVLEAAYVKGFESNRGWHWQFALQPGF